jgi:Family of unknown function (DUF6527)
MVIVHVYCDAKTGEETLYFLCPGCDNVHGVRVTVSKNFPGQICWDWNRDTAKPTISPSILCDGHDPERRCHTFVKAGRIEYLQDCFHKLRGTTIDMVELPLAYRQD